MNKSTFQIRQDAAPVLLGGLTDEDRARRRPRSRGAAISVARMVRGLLFFSGLFLVSVILGPERLSADVWEFRAGGEVVFHESARRARDRSAHEILIERRRAAYSPLIESAADEHGVDPDLVHALIEIESAYDATAVSDQGAAGLMQLIPGTAERFGVEDRFDPQANVEGGTRYLRWLLDLFDDDESLAVAAYHAGENRVRGRGGRRARVPAIPATQEHVRRVRAALTRLRGTTDGLLVYPGANSPGVATEAETVASVGTPSTGDEK